MNEFVNVPRPLLDWYQKNKRDLPWRKNSDPYRVWVSEIMLQQTRVEAVKEYYTRFLEALPTVQDLAECEEEKLLKLWEGLGYYSRVRNMQKTAVAVVEKYGGVFPSDEKTLKKLSGIGEYTAGAISSIAFGKRVAAVDGNVMRVLSRYAQNPMDISNLGYRAYLKERLEEIYPSEGVECSDFTQALMELGALICTPQVYRCEECPLKSSCQSYRYGTQEVYPVLPQKKEKKKEQIHVFLLETENGISVRKREGGVLKGLYEFPSFPLEKSWQDTLKGLGIQVVEERAHRTYRHIFTHVEWEMYTHYVRVKSSPFEEVSLVDIEERIALPTAFKRCLSIIREK